MESNWKKKHISSDEEDEEMKAMIDI